MYFDFGFIDKNVNTTAKLKTRKLRKIKIFFSCFRTLSTKIKQ